MKKNIRLFAILTRVKHGHYTPEKAHDEILSLLDGSELGSLAAGSENGSYSTDRKSCAKRADSTEKIEQTSDETIGKIIDEKEDGKMDGWTKEEFEHWKWRLSHGLGDQ